MADFLWRQGSRTIARYVSSDLIELNTIARLNSDEVCGYQEGGVYVGTCSSIRPNLKPKPGFGSRLIGRKAPQRDYLFVHKGPHKLIMKINSKWGSREQANILAIITISFPTDLIGRLFSLARGASEGIITASELTSAVELDVSVKFQEYVLGLNNPNDFTTKEDIIRIENEFAQIAEDEFTIIGVVVESVTLNFADTDNEKLVDLQSEADRLMQTGIGIRKISTERSLASTATKLSSLADSMEEKAIIEAHGELSDRAARNIARAQVGSQERELIRRIEEIERESISSQNIRGTQRDVEEKKAIIEAAKALQSMFPNSDGDGAENVEE